jgi:EAL domain-containing protein (putative c-di-GMP-specific phosphodiesterase class I)
VRSAADAGTGERFVMEISPRHLQRGIERGELRFDYQPKVSFLTGEVCGAEALLRWRREDGTEVSPEDFVPLAEAWGVITDLTEAMFPRFLADTEVIENRHPKHRIAFNVSADDLDAPRFIAMLREAIDQHRVAAGRLELEVTEGAVVSGKKSVLGSLQRLVAEGVELAMDDYGIGFSSLESLHRLPFSSIKLDQSFVLRVLHSPKSAVLVKLSIAMAQMLGIRTVVEGVESKAIYDSLLHSGCSAAQGYWIGRPMPLDEYLGFVDARPSWPSSPIGLLRMAQLAHHWQERLLVDLVFAAMQSVDPVGDIPLDFHLDETECELGKWYYGVHRHFAGDPDFDALEAPHRAMHELCGEVFSALKTGDRSRILDRLLYEISDNSCRVTGCLHRLETKALVREAG